MAKTSGRSHQSTLNTGADTFAEWFIRQGCHVARTASTFWVKRGPGVYQAFPYHWIIHPTEDELERFLRDSKAISLRYSTSADAPEGKLSYHVVHESKDYDLSNLSKKARYDVRKGLKYASIEPVSFRRLATEGWKLQADTLQRQRRTGSETEEEWRRLCLTAEDLPGFEAWGALHKGELVASLLAFTFGDCCTFLYQQSATAHLQNCVNNALTYVFTSEMLRRPHISRMFYCLDSLDAKESMDEFKFRMGYKAMPVRQRVVFHPNLRLLVNPLSHTVTRHMVRLMPDRPILAKAEGMLRFCLEGKVSEEKQSEPAALQRHRLHREREMGGHLETVS